MDEDVYVEEGASCDPLSMDQVDGPDCSPMSLEQLEGCDPAWFEVVVESEPSSEDLILQEDLPCAIENNDLMGAESLLQSSTTVNSVTELIGQDTRTTFEHVNEIIKHGAAAVRSNRTGPTIVHQQSPSSLTHRKPRNVIKKVIIVQPGDDAERVTAEAINRITEDLNQEAAHRLAEGNTLENETVIEITRINTPLDGHLSLGSGTTVSHYPHQVSPTMVLDSPERRPLSPAERKHHRRKSPHPKRYMYHTPSPPQAKCRRIRKSDNLSSQCYFESKPKPASSTSGAMATASAKLLGLVAQPRPHTPVSQVGVSQPAPAASVSHTIASAKLVQSSLQQKASILRTVRQASVEFSCPTQVPQLPSHSLMMCPASVTVNRTTASVVDRSTAPVSAMETSNTSIVTSGQTRSKSVSESGSKHNESLTNIQWLGNMSGDPLDSTRAMPHKDARVIASERQIDMISKECGRKKRPPYSYMHLIQMAICSSDEKRMTLKEIYSWIEEKFPFYKFCPNQGWKNSIRHNLSLYDIFVREKTSQPRGKAGSSYWTLRPDVPVQTVRALQNLMSRHSAQLDNAPNSSQDFIDSIYSCQPLPLSPVYSPGEGSLGATVSGSKKKGPVPLLPKPPAMQTYALIPIQGGVPVIPQQPIMVSSLPSTPELPHSMPAAPAKELRRVRSSSATDFLKTSQLHHRASDLARERSGHGQRPGSAFELLRSSSMPGPSVEVCGRLAPMPAISALDLLSGLKVRPHGLSTPPPQQYSNDMAIRSQEKILLKRSSSPDLAGPSHKQVKVSQTAAFKNLTTRPQNWNKSTKVPRSNTVCDSQESIGAELSTVHDHLSHIRLADSGFISDSSASDQTANSSGLPKPIMYMSLSKTEDDEYVLTGTPSDRGSEVKSTLLTVDCNTEVGINDILSSIEKSLSSPMRNLLRTPPKSAEKNLFTSTPFKMVFESPSWLSPIKGLTPIAGDPSLEGSLFTPMKDVKAVTSTPTFKVDSEVPGRDRDNRTPPEDNKKGSTPIYNFPSLTPLKTPFKSSASKDPKPSSSSDVSASEVFNNQSFSKFLGDFHFESMIDEGINMDVSNMSFSAFQ